MYAHQDIWLEDICFEHEHVDEVVAELHNNFDEYFTPLLELKLETIYQQMLLKK